jgi:hypothetical protein
MSRTLVQLLERKPELWFKDMVMGQWIIDALKQQEPLLYEEIDGSITINVVGGEISIGKSDEQERQTVNESDDTVWKIQLGDV